MAPRQVPGGGPSGGAPRRKRKGIDEGAPEKEKEKRKRRTEEGIVIGRKRTKRSAESDTSSFQSFRVPSQGKFLGEEEALRLSEIAAGKEKVDSDYELDYDNLSEDECTPLCSVYGPGHCSYIFNPASKFFEASYAVPGSEVGIEGTWEAPAAVTPLSVVVPEGAGPEHFLTQISVLKKGLERVVSGTSPVRENILPAAERIIVDLFGTPSPQLGMFVYFVWYLIFSNFINCFALCRGGEG